MTTILHAPATNRLLHAEQTMGERNSVFYLATLTDENGVTLTDQNGLILTAWGQTSFMVIHAPATNRLLHAENSS